MPLPFGPAVVPTTVLPDLMESLMAFICRPPGFCSEQSRKLLLNGLKGRKQQTQRGQHQIGVDRREIGARLARVSPRALRSYMHQREASEAQNAISGRSIDRWRGCYWPDCARQSDN